MKFDCSKFWCIFLASAMLRDYKEESLGEVQLFRFWCIFLASTQGNLPTRRGRWVKFVCLDFGVFSWLPLSYFTLQVVVAGEVRMFIFWCIFQAATG